MNESPLIYIIIGAPIILGLQFSTNLGLIFKIKYDQMYEIEI